MKIKIILVVLIAIILLIQLIPVNKSNPPVSAEIITSTEIKSILEKSCYDCHSNQTRWPWYSKIAPVSWGISYHVKEGRSYVNFSYWQTLTFEQKNNLKQEIFKEISNNKMPIKSYTLIHRNAGLTNEEKQQLTLWANQKESEENSEGIIF